MGGTATMRRFGAAAQGVQRRTEGGKKRISAATRVVQQQQWRDQGKRGERGDELVGCEMGTSDTIRGQE